MDIAICAVRGPQRHISIFLPGPVVLGTLEMRVGDLEGTAFDAGMLWTIPSSAAARDVVAYRLVVAWY